MKRNRASNAGHSAAGFTLIEILIAISLLAIVGMLGFRGLSQLQQTVTHLIDTGSRLENIARSSERLLSDIGNALPLIETSAAQPPFLLRTTPAPEALNLSLTRPGTLAGEGIRVHYHWQASTQRIEMQLWPLGHADTPGATHLLLDGVRRLQIEGLDAHGVWHPEWPPRGEQALPRLVRIILTLNEGQSLERWIDVRSAE